MSEEIKKNFVCLKPLKEQGTYELTFNVSNGETLILQNRIFLKEIEEPEVVEYADPSDPDGSAHMLDLPIDLDSVFKK